MRQRRSSARWLITGALAAAVCVGAAGAAEPSGAEKGDPAAEWAVELIDSVTEVGYHVSVATDPVTGRIFISYYDGATGELQMAKMGGPHHNCGPSNSWSCSVLDSGDVVGKYNSIAVGGTGPIGTYYVSYYDSTNGALKVIEGTIDRETGVMTKFIRFIDRGDPGGEVYTGKYTSIDVGGSGTPHIAYQVDVGALQGIKYATRVAEGTGNCGEGDVENDWECSHVHLESDIGEFIAIDVSAGGTPSIAFSTAFALDTYPVLATRVVSGGTCNNSDLWNCEGVRHMGNDTSDWLAFVIGDNAQPHLFYRNATTESLEWATFVETGGNCGGLRWECRTIESIGYDSLLSGIAAEIDDDRNPVVVYQDVESGNLDLKIARPREALNYSAAGNCGPLSPTMFHTWRCETLDAGDLSHDEAVGGLSISMDSRGQAAVAYRELFDPISSPEEGRLKVALEPTWIFADGFESGNTSAW